VIRRLAAALLAAAVLTAAPASAQAPVAGTIRYAGDRNFPPYEYLDATGQPAGFNIALIRQAAARSGLLVHIELGEWSTMFSRFDAGEFDVMMLGYSEARAQKDELRSQIWTLHQVVLIKPTDRRGPQNLGQLSTETVAVLRRSLIEELLLALPEVQRPTILPTPDQESAVRMIAEGRATAAAGNSLTLKMAAERLGVRDLQEIPVKSLAYYLAARRDDDPRVDRLARAIDELERDGALGHLIEEHLTMQTVVAPWRAYAEWVAGGVAIVLLVLTGVGFCNRSLTQQVRLRTEALQVSEARYRALVDNSSDIIH
jgi:polar amino acid transport system substrate-binding protein